MQLTVITPDAKENFPYIPMLYCLTFFLQCICIICNELWVNFILSALLNPGGPPKGMAMWLANGVSRVGVPFYGQIMGLGEVGCPSLLHRGWEQNSGLTLLGWASSGLRDTLLPAAQALSRYTPVPFRCPLRVISGHRWGSVGRTIVTDLGWPWMNNLPDSLKSVGKWTFATCPRLPQCSGPNITHCLTGH